MKKFFAVFCLLTLLATLFSCSGIPALASTKNTPKQAETKTKKVKSGRKKESVDVMKYVKKGVFDYEGYSKAIKADNPFYNGAAINFAFGDYIIEISTSLQSSDEFYIGVGTLEDDAMLGDITYFSLFKHWEGSVPVKDGINVPKNGLKLLNKVVDYVHTLKHPDPHKKPKIKGFNFLEWDKMPKAADSD